MKVTAIIAEYNPFHNGHAYQIEQIRQATDADAILVIMSGDFVQRGTPAIYDTYTRARAALVCGVDVVIELPVYFATGSAEYFAAGAVTLLNQLNCVDTLCFGCECENLSLLSQIADILADEPAVFGEILRSRLKKGQSFPAAREEALWNFLQSSESLPPHLSREMLSHLLGSPNNILAIEYLKQLKRTHATIRPYAIKRQGSGYLDINRVTSMPSAMAIRTMLSEGLQPIDLAHCMPPAALSVLRDAHGAFGPVYCDDFTVMLHYQLVTGQEQGFAGYLDCTQDLSNKICKHLPDYRNFTAFAESLWSQDITTARIYRCLIHILLGLRKEEMETLQETGLIHYARILGIGNQPQTSELTSALKVHSQIPLLTKVSKAASLLSPVGNASLQKDLLANSIYRIALSQKTKKTVPDSSRRLFLKLLCGEEH